MRLFNANTKALEMFLGSEVPRYVYLITYVG